MVSLSYLIQTTYNLLIYSIVEILTRTIELNMWILYSFTCR